MTSSPNNGWVLRAANLDLDTARTLLRMSQDLFPHDQLAMQHYATVVDSLDMQAGADQAIRQLLIDGVVRLDAVHGLPWIDLGDRTREASLRCIEKTEFFLTVRTETIHSLYRNPVVYRLFGYGGPSKEFGGYINRGFDDLSWLSDS